MINLVVILNTFILEDGFVTSFGYDIHFLEWGKTGKRVVALHSMRQDAHAFDSFSKAFSSEGKVLALDLLGHGDSDKPTKEVTLDEHTEIIRGVVKKRRLSDVILIGHSVGGYISMIYAAENIGEVSKLILVDIGPRDPEADRLRTRRWQEPPEYFANKNEAKMYFKESYPKYPDNIIENRLKHNLILANGLLKWKSDPKSLDMIRNTFMNYDFWPHVKKIKIPTLLIKGAESETVSKKTLDRMEKILNDFTLIEIEESGHQVPMDNPEAFESAVKKFIAEV
jgi:pimeloyl-ACP methyl ester carboxylesterase